MKRGNEGLIIEQKKYEINNEMEIHEMEIQKIIPYVTRSMGVHSILKSQSEVTLSVVDKEPEQPKQTMLEKIMGIFR